MEKNKKKFELFVFLSTFSRSLIEVFIPIILYKFGYTLKEVIFYFMMSHVFSFIIAFPFIWISKKYNNKILTFIGIIAFVILQILLNNITSSIYYLLLIGFLFAVYRRGYWISRRYYNMKVIKKEKVASTFSIISIINHLGVLISSYVGSLLLDFMDINTVTYISIALFLISLIPLFKMEFKHIENNSKINIIQTLKNVSFRNMYLFGTYELVNVVKFLFTLYLFIYVKDTYSTVGLFNLITNISVLVFTYSYGKKIDGKKNFLKASIILTVLTYILKANTTYIMLVIASFLEGLFIRMYEISISKEFYVLSKKFEYNDYNLMYEISQNAARSITLFILFISNMNLKLMIYTVLFFILLGMFIDFKQSDSKDYIEKES